MRNIFKFYLHQGKAFLIYTCISVSIFSCRTAELAVNENLRNDTDAYSVKGRQDSQIGQVISFGDFKTNKVKRGWKLGYSIPFFVKFQGAGEKLSFSLSSADGKSADVALVSKFKETEYEPFKEYFAVSLKYKNYFVGAVRLDNSEEWDFIVHDVDGASRSLKQNSTIGFVRKGHIKIDITGIRSLEGSSDFITQNQVYGYEFQQNGKVIGAVSTINYGKVWLKKDLHEETKLVLASVSSGLMLRNSMAENELSMK